MSLGAYETVEVLHESARTRVVRARRVADGRPVVLKELRSAFPSPEELGAFRREHEVLDSLGGAGAPAVLAFDVTEGVARIVMADAGSLSLAALLAARRPTVREALALAAQVAEALEHVHAKGLLHLDVNPANVIVASDGACVQLIDFGLATDVPRGVASPRPIAFIEGTPAYLAPESTGRTNRSVDARADLYALGVTLFELFAGALPFTCDDLLAYVHAHLARSPPELAREVPGVPALVSKLVATLLRKRPEERYQSAAGVAVDLRRCLDATLRGDPDEASELACRALGTRPELPQELRGREAELATLLDAFDATLGGTRGAVLVSGEPGIGKTALVFELQRPVTVARGRMLLGKFDQFSRDVPYSAVAQALGGLFEELLAEPAETAAAWRDRIVAAVAPNGRVLADVAPGAVALLGPQPEVEELGPAETEHRLQETLRRVFRCVAGPGSAVVLFLDDLQWADLPSLRLVESLFRDAELQHFLLVGAWRDTEASARHAIGPTVDALRGAGSKVYELHLGPLSTVDVARLLADALRCDAAAVRDLAAVLHEKSGGNPFFLRRLVDELGADGTLRFDRGALAWCWNLSDVRRSALADNVVALLRGEIETLSGDARRCLSTAAWIGARFDVELLSRVTGVEPGALLGELHVAARRRFVRPLDDEPRDAGGRRGRAFAFVHDRVQQAAGELLSPDDTTSVRLAIARGILALRHGAPQDAEIFRVAEHYDAAIARVTDAEELARVVALHHEAARRALLSGAHAAAHRFVECALASAGDDVWDRDEVLARSLQMLSARAAWLVGDHALMRSRVDALRTHARTAVQALQAEQVLIQSQIARWELHEGISGALAALAPVGVVLPRHPALEDVMRAIGEALAAIGARTTEDLRALPVADDATELELRRVLVGISSASYVATPNLLPVLSALLVVRSVERGLSRESAYGFGVFALSLCAGWHLGLGYEYGRLALRLLERLPDPALGGRTRHVVNHFVRCWTEPLRPLVAEAQEIARVLLDAGDLEFAGWSLHANAVYGYLSGVDLASLRETVDRSNALMAQHGLEAPRHCTLQFATLMRALRGELADPTRLVGDGYDEVAALERYRAMKFRGAVLVLSVCMLTARMLFRDYAAAREASRLAFEFQDGAAAIFYQCTFRAYAAVAELADVENASADERAARIASVRGWRVEVAAAAERAPHNAGHLLALMDAELARADGDLVAAIEQYDRAIAAAEAGGFVHDEALANERAGLFHLGRGARSVARAYLQESRFAWQRWGATAKVAQLDALHADLLARSALAPPAATPSSQGTAAATLDLDTLLKASQAMSGEVALDGLLKRAIAVLLESAGARKCVLLLRGREGLALEAEGRVDGAGVELLGGAAFEDGARVPPSLVRRVWRRGALEVHDDVSALHEFATDPYLRTSGPCSVLCAPVQYQGRALGVVYLENDLATGAFRADRARVVEVLAPQLAISVVNAQHHQEMLAVHQAANRTLESKVDERTRDLTTALADLKLAQQQMIQSEKLAALGQLVGSIAHEINTPMGAIRASAQNLSESVRNAAHEWSALLGYLDAERLPEFFALLEGALAPREPLSTREERAVRRTLTGVLDALHVPNPQVCADQLVQMGVRDDVGPFLGLLRSPEGPRALRLAHDVTGQSRSCAAIVTAVERAAKIVFALKSYARHGLRGERVEANLIDGLEVVLTLYGSQLKAGVEVVREYDAEPRLSCFPDELVQVWTNLVHNALQAMSFAGKLRIAVSIENGSALVRITDDGRGIDESVRDRIFEPFFTTKPLGEGSGLGLHIVREIVDRHDGDIRFESRPGETTFTVSLPCLA